MTTQHDLPRILVVDDNPAIHDDFRKVLCSAPNRREMDEVEALFFRTEAPETATPSIATPSIGYELVDAFQGKDALELFTRSIEEGRPFDMAFVDMRMPPGWNGLETIRKLWEADPNLQVVVCTAFSDYSWADLFSELGPKDGLLILKKPFDQAEVLQLASSLTQKRNLIRLASAKLATMEKLVSERTSRLAQAHQESEQMLAAISCLMVRVDSWGTINRYNETAVELFGIPADQALGRPMLDLPVNWTDRAVIEKMLDQQNGRSTQRDQVVFQKQSGELCTLGVTIYPVFDDSEWNGYLILGTDITEQKELESQLRQSQKLESVGQLAAGVAHEINTPMQFIGDNVRYVAKSFDRLMPALEHLATLADPDVTDLQLDEIQQLIGQTVGLKKITTSLQQIPAALNDSIDGVDSVSKIVAAMKEFSHPGTEGKSLICVNHVLESTITVAKNEWKYVAAVETNFDENLPQVAALRSELNQAFLNIIVNAAHAIGDRVTNGEIETGQIRIATTSLENAVEITVQDNGGGIPTDVQARVFDPFFTTKDVGRGTGQGLAIAYSVIVQKHGGKLWFDVEEEIGTTFHIQLPCQEAIEPEAFDTEHFTHSAD